MPATTTGAVAIVAPPDAEPDGGGLLIATLKESGPSTEGHPSPMMNGYVAVWRAYSVITPELELEWLQRPGTFESPNRWCLARSTAMTLLSMVDGGKIMV